MYVVELFLEKIIGMDGFYIIPVLPELVVFDFAIIGTAERTSIYQPFLTTLLLILLNCLYKAFAGELLEVAQNIINL